MSSNDSRMRSLLLMLKSERQRFPKNSEKRNRNEDGYTAHALDAGSGSGSIECHWPGAVVRIVQLCGRHETARTILWCCHRRGTLPCRCPGNRTLSESLGAHDLSP